ncbi:DUF1804 family protein [Alistipes sp.]|uniref:DUF1804 family protein n=1 Tax=Alistipes sp. TaxID=1872444 RepID=UPI003AB69944
MAKQTKKPRTKRELDVLRDYAFRLYLAGETQRVIAAKTDLTEATVSKWANEDDWERQRKEQSTSSLALVNSLMLAARKISERIVEMLGTGETDNIASITKLSDNIAKVMASAKRIAKGITKDEVIDVIIDLEQWLMQRMETDDELTPELISTINSYHKKYIEFISAQE